METSQDVVFNILRIPYWYAVVFLSSVMLNISCCPDGYVKLGRSCYYISTDSATNWYDARMFCQSAGGDLLVINSQDEMDALSPLLKLNYFWIGLNDIANDGDWQWVNGKKFSPFEINGKSWWAQGNPDNRLVKEDCAEYKFASNSLNDVECSINIHYVCERATESTYCKYPWLTEAHDSKNCYMVSRKMTSWNNARIDCQSQGGDLLVISSSKELTWITMVLREEKMERIWLGLRDAEESGNTSKWMWIDETPLDTSIIPWGYGEPNSFSSDEDCVLYSNFPIMYDMACWFNYEYVCEANQKATCLWPPNLDMQNVISKCIDHYDNNELICGNYMESGSIVELKCIENSYSSTGIPVAYSICRNKGDWSNVEAFKCSKGVMRSDDMNHVPFDA